MKPTADHAVNGHSAAGGTFGGLARLVDQAPDAIYHYDLATRQLRYCNERFRQLFGAPADDAGGHGRQAILATYRQSSFELIGEALAAGQGEGRIEYSIVGADGKTRWVDERWKALPDSSGRPLAVEGVIRDTPPVRMTEAQFTRSKENALIGNYIVQQGRFKYVNAEFERISGYRASELLGTDPLALVQEDYRHHARTNAIAMLKGVSTTPSEFCVRGKSGDTRWIMETVSPLVYEGQRAVLGYFMDITQLRQMQDNLSSIGLMVGTISHSLRSCLTGMEAGLYLAETGFYRNTPARIEEGLDVAQLMQDRIRKLVGDILYHVKERPLEFEEMEVWRFAKEVAVSMETRIRAANIDFITRLPEGGGTFLIDTEIVRAALVNILENAMEACIEDHGRPKHQITFEVRTDPNQIHFTIRDNGPGIPQDQMQLIFQIFHSTKGRRGTGLGLHVTRKVILRHGGHITAASPAGQGAEFSITLPRRPPEDL